MSRVLLILFPVLCLIVPSCCKSFVGFTPVHWNNQETCQQIFRAGIGYSMKHRDVTLPMFIQGHVERLQENRGEFHRYLNADEMLTSMYLNQKEASATMYSHREAGEVVYRDFFAESTHSAVFVSNVISIRATIGSELEPDFQEALRLLPETYDQQIYLEFCNLWGCSVIVEAFFGGSVESQLSLRTCSSVPNVDLDRDLSIASTSGKFPDMSYSRFVNTKRINIVGGNPEIQDPSARIATFDQLPVLVAGSLVPLHEYLSEKYKEIPQYLVANLERAYNEELRQAQEHLDTMKQQGYQRMIEDLSSQRVYHVAANDALDCSHRKECRLSFVRESCFYQTRTRTGINACVVAGDIHLQVGQTVNVQQVEGGYFMEITRYNDGSLQPTFISTMFGQDIYRVQYPPFSNGCVSHVYTGFDAPIRQYLCIGCQPTIRHEGANEYFDCTCSGF